MVFMVVDHIHSYLRIDPEWISALLHHCLSISW